MSLLQPPRVKAQQVQPRADATAGVPGGAEEKEERKLPARKRDPGDADRGLFTHFHKLPHLFFFFLEKTPALVVSVKDGSYYQQIGSSSR